MKYSARNFHQCIIHKDLELEKFVQYQQQNIFEL